MNNEKPRQHRTARQFDELYRELIRTWGRRLRASGFSDKQAARLIYIKLLYIRGKLDR